MLSPGLSIPPNGFGRRNAADVRKLDEASGNRAFAEKLVQLPIGQPETAAELHDQEHRAQVVLGAAAGADRRRLWQIADEPVEHGRRESAVCDQIDVGLPRGGTTALFPFGAIEIFVDNAVLTELLAKEGFGKKTMQKERLDFLIRKVELEVDQSARSARGICQITSRSFMRRVSGTRLSQGLCPYASLPQDIFET